MQAAAVGPTLPALASVAGLRAGHLRRASYSGSLMGSKVGAWVGMQANRWMCMCEWVAGLLGG